MGVKYMKKSEKITASMKVKVIEALTDQAEQQNRTLSNMIETACIWYLDNLK